MLSKYRNCIQVNGDDVYLLLTIDFLHKVGYFLSHMIIITIIGWVLL